MSTRIRYFAINVEKNNFRRERISQQCADIGIPLEIFKAITPATIGQVPNTYQPALTALHWGRPLLPTELACALSHLSLWRELLADSSADYYFILEDDADVHKNLPAIISGINFDGIDFIKFSGTIAYRPSRQVQKINEDFSLHRLVYGNLGAMGYMLSKKAATDLVAFCQSCHMAIDILMDRSYEHGVPVYAVLPYPVEAEFSTDTNNPIASEIGVRHKYAANISAVDKLKTRIIRALTSLKRRIAELKFLLHLD